MLEKSMVFKVKQRAFVALQKSARDLITIAFVTLFYFENGKSIRRGYIEAF